MLDNSRQPWTNDPWNLTLIVGVIAALAAISFVIAHGLS